MENNPFCVSRFESPISAVSKILAANVGLKSETMARAETVPGKI